MCERLALNESNETKGKTMKIFENIKGYANAKNAEKKLRDVLGDRIDDYAWHIGVNSNGRFYPVVSCITQAGAIGWLAHSGICVTN